MLGRHFPGRRSEEFNPVEFDRSPENWLSPNDSGLASRFESMELTFRPVIDVRETDNAIEVSIELPGLTEKDITVSIDRDLLTVTGEKKSAWESNESGVLCHERSFGSFSRCIGLPDGLDEGNLDAKFKDGVLTVTVPKSTESEQNHRTVAGKKNERSS